MREGDFSVDDLDQPHVISINFSHFRETGMKQKRYDRVRYSCVNCQWWSPTTTMIASLSQIFSISSTTLFASGEVYRQRPI